MGKLDIVRMCPQRTRICGTEHDKQACHRRLVKDLLHLIPSVLDNGEYFVTELFKSSTDDGIKIIITAKRR